MDIELGENQLGRSKANSSAHQESQSISVEVGEERVESFRALMELPHPHDALVDVRANIAVGKRNGFGNAIGATGVQNDGKVLGRGAGGVWVDEA